MMQQTTAASPMQAMRERILGAWQVLDAADIDRSGGSLDKLAATISRKTGRPRADIRRELLRLLAA